MRDHYSAPEIHASDLAKYHLDAGGPILIRAADDFEVVRVTVSLDDASGGLLAEGEATYRTGKWEFTAPPLPPGFPAPMHVVATAYDRPGNATMKKVAVVAVSTK